MKIAWTEEQLALLLKMPIPFDVTKDLTDDEYCDLNDYVCDFMLSYFIKDDKIVGDGLICEDILYIVNSD